MRMRRWILLGSWILSLVVISFFGGTISYGFFFAVTLLPLVCVAYLIAVTAGFRIYQNLESRNVVAGQPVEYYFVLQNEMPFAFAGLQVRLFSGLFEVADVPDNREYELLPGENFRFETKLSCKYRGEYEVGVQAVVITDFLHLFRWKYTLPGTIKAIVSPKVVTLDALQSLASLQIDTSDRCLRGDAEPDVEVRDYVRGDSIKRVHWKATARTGDWKVRRTIDEERQGIRLYLWGKRYSEEQEHFLPLENRMLEIVLAVAATLLQKRIPIAVEYQTERVPVTLSLQEEQDFPELYRCMEEYSFRPELSSDGPEAFLQNCLQALPKVVFLVAAELPESILEYTQMLAEEGVCVVIYLVEQDAPFDVAGLDRERHKIIPVGTEEELETVL